MASQLNADFRVAIVGHSYIKHLKNFATELPNKTEFSSVAPKSPRPNLLDLDNCSVQWYGLSGSTVPTLAANNSIRKGLNAFDPHLVFMQIGSNDLDNETSKPIDVAYAISELADEFVQEYSCHKVLVGKLVERKKTRNIDVDEYNEKVQFTNTYLQNFCDDLSSFNTPSFWHHKGIVNPAKNIYYKDRVHMNDLGNLKLYRSIRSGVLASMKLFYYF